MNNKTSFSNQVEILSDFSKELEMFSLNLEKIAGTLEQSLSVSHNKGLMDEIFLVLKERSITKVATVLTRLSEHIQSEDLLFIEQEIDFLTSRLESLNLKVKVQEKVQDEVQDEA